MDEEMKEKKERRENKSEGVELGREKQEKWMEDMTVKRKNIEVRNE